MHKLQIPTESTVVNDRIQLLQAVPFFGAINEASIMLLLELAETTHAKKGDFFFRQGERGDSLYLLEKGHALAFKQWENQECHLRHIKDGDCFGELALIDFSPRSASVRAETDCTTIRIPSTVLHELYQADPEQFLIIQMNIAREVSRRLRKSDERWFQHKIQQNVSKVV